MMLLNILFLFVSIGFSAYKVKILETPVLHFFPILKLHHVIIIEDEESGSMEAFDFTPINQKSFKTIGKLFLGLNVPAEIRVLSILKKDLSNKKSLVESLEKASAMNISSKNKKIMIFLKEWKNDSMNLYCHNCQHFSGFLKKRITSDS
jgi:hypothetical protein